MRSLQQYWPPRDALLAAILAATGCTPCSNTGRHGMRDILWREIVHCQAQLERHSGTGSQCSLSRSTTVIWLYLWNVTLFVTGSQCSLSLSTRVTWLYLWNVTLSDTGSQYSLSLSTGVTWLIYGRHRVASVPHSTLLGVS